MGVRREGVSGSVDGVLGWLPALSDSAATETIVPLPDSASSSVGATSKEVGVTGASTFPVRSATCCERRRRGSRESAWGERSQRAEA